MLKGKCQFFFYLLVLTLHQNLCVAQTGPDSPDQQASAANQQIPSTIIQELEAMKKRIEQLEAELKSRTVEEHPAVGVARESKTPLTVHVRPEEKPAPFSFADFTWLNGTPRNKDSVLDSKYFTGEFRVDSSYIYDTNHPIDHSLGGTTEGTRTGEFQVQHLGVGGDFHVGNMQGRLLTQFGMYSTATPRNDASPAIGQWNLADAYRYVSEAYGGYHLDVQNGINMRLPPGLTQTVKTLFAVR